MGCKPITQKAKSSPFKMSVALVQNDAQTHKGFVDVASDMGKGMDEAQKRIDANKPKAKKEISGNVDTSSVTSAVNNPVETKPKKS